MYQSRKIAVVAFAFGFLLANGLCPNEAHAQIINEDIKLFAQDGAEGDSFGNSVSVSGDTAIVGAQFDDDNGSQSGSAYLFDINTGAQLAKLLPTDNAAGDRFGRSVGISGDTAIVGAQSDDDNGFNSGSAYLFDIIIGAQIAKFLPKDGAAEDHFGESVAICGSTAIIGARYDDDNGTDSGSAYLFDINTGEQIAKLLPPDGAAGDNFGFSVAISGDIAIIGAGADDDNGSASGSAYLFDINTGVQIAKLLPSDGATGDNFGISVAISGDIAIVGATANDDNGSYSGSAYLFDINTGAQIAKLLPTDNDAGDWFGRSVDISGDIAFVGAHSDDDKGTNSGSAYHFNVNTGAEIAKLLPLDGAEGDWFGKSVAVSGDTAIVGAQFDDDNGSESGSAYLFNLSQGKPEVAELAAFDVQFGTLLSGGLPELATSDDQHLTIQSQFGFLSSEPNVMRVQIDAMTSVDSPVQFDATIESRANNPDGTATVRARNWKTNAMMTIGTFGIGTTDEVVVIEELPADPYIRDSDGRIQIDIKHVIVATFSLSGFQSRLDRVEFLVE